MTRIQCIQSKHVRQLLPLQSQTEFRRRLAVRYGPSNSQTDPIRATHFSLPFRVAVSQPKLKTNPDKIDTRTRAVYRSLHRLVSAASRGSLSWPRRPETTAKCGICAASYARLLGGQPAPRLRLQDFIKNSNRHVHRLFRFPRVTQFRECNTHVYSYTD